MPRYILLLSLLLDSLLHVVGHTLAPPLLHNLCLKVRCASAGFPSYVIMSLLMVNTITCCGTCAIKMKF
jgi:hypothetical protein